MGLRSPKYGSQTLSRQSRRRCTSTRRNDAREERPMTLLVALLLLADTQQGPQPATAQRFEQVAKQAAQAREQGHPGEAERLYREGVRLHPNWGEGCWDFGRSLSD